MLKNLRQKRKREEHLVLRQCSFNLEREIVLLKRRTADLQEEVKMLLSYRADEDDGLPEWILQFMNQSLKDEVRKYRGMTQQHCEFFELSNRVLGKNEIYNMTQMNALFLVEKIPELSQKHQPSLLYNEGAEQYGRMTALYQQMLRICCQHFALETDQQDFNLDVNELFSWKPELKFDLSKARYDVFQNDKKEKWVSVTVDDFPVARSKLKQLLSKIDIFSVMMMTSRAIKASIDENGGGDLNKGFSHSFGYSDAVVPLSVFGIEGTSVGPFHCQYRRPLGMASKDLAFISISDFETEEEYTLIQSFLPFATADLQSLSSDGALFARNLTLRKGNEVHGKETTSMSLLIGLNQTGKYKNKEMNDPHLLESFLAALELLNGDKFMDRGMHSAEKVVRGLEAILKTALFVQHKLSLLLDLEGI